MTPWSIAAFMYAGAVSGVKLRITPPPLPAACTSCRMAELASVTGSLVGTLLNGIPAAFATLLTPPSEYAATVSGDAMTSDFAPRLTRICAAPMAL